MAKLLSNNEHRLLLYPTAFARLSRVNYLNAGKTGDKQQASLNIWMFGVNRFRLRSLFFTI